MGSGVGQRRATAISYRVWSVADLGAYIRMAQAIAVKLTPAAQAKMADTPPRLDVCRPQGMPGIMLNPLPIRFVDRGDHIDLELASFGVLRRIDMVARPDPAAIPALRPRLFRGTLGGRHFGSSHHAGGLAVRG